MANKVNILPNLRIDIPDFEGSTQEFTDADNKERFQAVFQDRYAHVPEGFRVEIPDQGAFPGQVNVHNGLSFDRSGKLVTSESAPDTQRSIVLTGTTVYYLEVEFTEESSFVDARAFWDPNFDNGTDPSGDVRASGREFNQNVATRKVPEWRIVSPVSTTGFEINSIPSSNKIPLAVIHVTANVVVDGGGPTPIPLRTSLKEDYPAGTTAIKVLNSRSMPQVFTCDIGAESVAITANNQDNGILTIGGVTVSSHIAGERVTVTGGAVYLPQRTDPKPPTFPGASGTEDARPRLYSGDEEIGHAILQNADAGTGQSDAQIDNLKNYVDFLAGQIRQMKVGAARPENIGQTAPPFTFSPDFRYFEDAGGILGARTNTISVGDGVNTWGDYNTVQATSANLAIQGAIDAVPVGGIVYIKAGTYVLTSALSVTKPIRFVGDGHAVTIIDASAAATAFDLNTTGAVGLKDIGVTASGTAPYAMTITQCGPKSVFAGCSIEGLTSVDCNQSRFTNCAFTTPGSGDDAINGVFTNCVFDQCSADCSIALGDARAVLLGSGSTEVTFTECDLITTNPTPDLVFEFSGISAANIKFLRCNLLADGGGISPALWFPANGMSGVEIIGCTCTGPGGLGVFSGGDPALSPAGAGALLVDNCRVAVPQNGNGIYIHGSGITVRDSTFTQATSSAGTTGIAIRIDSSATGTTSFTNIRGNNLIDCDIGIWFAGVVSDNASINENKINCPTVSRGRYGVYFSGASVVSDLTLTGNTIDDLDDDSGATTVIAAIYAPVGSTVGIFRGEISGNHFLRIGAQFTVNLIQAYGIAIWDGCTTEALHITGNSFYDILADAFSGGIFLGITQHQRNRITDNEMRNIGSTLGGTPASQSYGGIWLFAWDHIVVSNNVMNRMGHAAATGQDASAILMGGALGSTTGNYNATISGNILDSLRHGGGFQHGISLDRNASNVSISGNHIGNFAGSYPLGINLRARNLANEFLENVAITGNIIRDVSEGIRVRLGDGGGGDFWENFVISGNIIERFDVFGIWFDGDDIPVPVTISGNSLVSPATAAVTAIHVRDSHVVTVSANSIYLSGNTGGHEGIEFIDVDIGTITGNTIMFETNAVGAIGIDARTLNLTSFITITGNAVHSNGGVGTGIWLGDESIASGNNSQGWATDISIIGAIFPMTQTQSYPRPGAPSGFDMNLRS